MTEDIVSEDSFLELREPSDVIFQQFDLSKQLNMLAKFGIEHQSIITIKECSELIKAIGQLICCEEPGYEDFKIRKTILTEEIADVLICMFQLIQFYEIKQSEIQLMIEYKEKTFERYGL